jgi:hypothetical protein
MEFAASPLELLDRAEASNPTSGSWRTLKSYFWFVKKLQILLLARDREWNPFIRNETEVEILCGRKNELRFMGTEARKSGALVAGWRVSVRFDVILQCEIHAR